ncbi:MAG: hypothetical protein HGB28_01540, partial [Oscillochloris sp.]|nr:hypothetical protein [Oscillochloris sp.]
MLLTVASAIECHPPAPASERLGALLAWLQQLLRWQIELTRQTYGALADDEYRGLYVPDAEVDLIGAAEPPLPPALAAERAALAAKRAALADDASSDTPLARLAQTFGLGPFEEDLLLLALAPELDLRFERVYAYIQDDVTRKRPSVDLALRLLCATPAERLAARAAFAPGAPLLHHRLIALFEDGQRQPPLLGRFIKLDDRIAAELVGHPTIDPALAGLVELTMPRRDAESLQLSPELCDRLRRAVASHRDGLVLALQGSYGSGRRAVAELLCAEAGRALLLVNTAQLVDGDGGPAQALGPSELARRIVREAVLRGAALLFSGADRLLGEEAGAAWRTAADRFWRARARVAGSVAPFPSASRKTSVAYPRTDRTS